MSIDYERIRQYHYIIYTDVPWALYTEYGATHMEPRPLFRPVAERWGSGRLEESFRERFSDRPAGFFGRIAGLARGALRRVGR